MEKDSVGEKLFLGFIYVAIALFTLSILYPLVYVVSASFSSAEALLTGQVVLWPVKPTLSGYELIFNNKMILTGYVNSLLYAVAGTVLSVAMTVMGAYALTKKELVGRSFFVFAFVFTMLFGGGLIPTYMVVRSVGFIDTVWSLLIPNCVVVFHLIIMITFYRTGVSQEILEAAEIDGCGHIQSLFRIAVPLSRPIIAVLCLFCAVAIWNTYFDALIYIRSQRLYPLQLVLRDILIQNQIKASDFSNMERYMRLRNVLEVMKYSTIVVASLPVLIAFPFVQKHFAKGVMIGSLKG